MKISKEIILKAHLYKLTMINRKIKLLLKQLKLTNKMFLITKIIKL
jgi:hypothetical protein